MTRRELGVALSIKIRVEPERKCWFIREDWSNYTTIKGEIAHRLVYKLCVGPLIVGQEICHRCDRKGCINPDHLYQDTHSKNMEDFRLKKKIRKIRKYIEIRRMTDGKMQQRWDEYLGKRKE